MDTRQTDGSPISPAASRSTSNHDAGGEPMDSVAEPIASLIRQIGIDKVYGTPITQGETTVVPVADLRTGFGFGGGHDATSGDGAGGGAGLRLSPQGYIEITADGVRYRPIYNVTTIALGGAFIGWLVYRLLSR